MKYPALFLTDLENQIRSYPKIQPAYSYPAEKGINPAYSDIEHCTELCLHEKRIWVLRTDFILAVGIKNLYAQYGNTNIFEKVEPCAQNPIDVKDPYGHPSLARPEGDYDGSAYYAGWLYQHESKLVVFLYTGRYVHLLCREEQQKTLEEYISIQFMNAFGEQDIIFHDYYHSKDIWDFLQGQSLSTPSRMYSSTHLENTKRYWLLKNKLGDRQLRKKINKADQYGYTPLHNAVSVGDIKLVKILIKNKANVSIRTKKTYQSGTKRYQNITALDMLERLNAPNDICPNAILMMKNILKPAKQTIKKEGWSELNHACINHLNCVDYYFEELQHFSFKNKIKELTQNRMIRHIFKRHCSYAAECCIEFLKTLPELELNKILTAINEDQKSISYYLLDNIDESYKDDLYGEYRLKQYFTLLQKVKPDIRAVILGLNLSDAYTLGHKIFYRCQKDADLLCRYLILLEYQVKILPPYIHPLSQQLVFEYIRNMKNTSEQDKLLEQALSCQSALHRFLKYTSDHLVRFCIEFFPGAQHLCVYISALSELKKTIEAQNRSWTSKAFQFFLPTPLNAIKLDQSRFNCGM